MIEFVSYHNQHPLYIACGQQLADSLEKVGIDNYHIEMVDAPGWDFLSACAYKPTFILQCLNQFPDADAIVYLDSEQKAMADSPRKWDQRVLQDLLDSSIGLYKLPPEYCKIFDLMANDGGEAVITQMQASRLSRGLNMDHNPIRMQGSL